MLAVTGRPTDAYLVVLVAARRMADSTGDLVGVGWVSVLSRGNTSGVQAAMAAYLGALRAAR